MTLEDVISFKKPTQKTPAATLIERRQELCAIIDSGEALLSEINNELLNRLNEQGISEMEVGERKVTKIQRVSFSQVPLEFAKKFRAVKKVVDGDVLRPLYKKGVSIPNVKISEYVSVK